MKKAIHPNNIVIFKDDVNEVPYLVHDVVFDGNKPVQVSLGLAEYPEIEQDNYWAFDDVEKLTGEALKKARKLIDKLMY
jgi:hypothetical protein